MKIAIVTNDAKTVTEHIGLAKQIAFYTLPDETLESIVTNPVQENIGSAKASQSPDGLLQPGITPVGADEFSIDPL